MKPNDHSDSESSSSSTEAPYQNTWKEAPETWRDVAQPALKNPERKKRNSGNITFQEEVKENITFQEEVEEDKLLSLRKDLIEIIFPKIYEVLAVQDVDKLFVDKDKINAEQMEGKMSRINLQKINQVDFLVYLYSEGLHPCEINSIKSLGSFAINRLSELDKETLKKFLPELGRKPEQEEVDQFRRSSSSNIIVSVEDAILKAFETREEVDPESVTPEMIARKEGIITQRKIQEQEKEERCRAPEIVALEQPKRSILARFCDRLSRNKTIEKADSRMG